jgi:hypothetical protein
MMKQVVATSAISAPMFATCITSMLAATCVPRCRVTRAAGAEQHRTAGTRLHSRGTTASGTGSARSQASGALLPVFSAAVKELRRPAPKTAQASAGNGQ